MNKDNNISTEDKLLHLLFAANKAVIKRGDVFWYRKNKNTYGAVVLDVIGNYTKNYLIALTEKLSENTRKIDTNIILNGTLYTVAWFSEFTLLPDRQVHICGSLNVTDDYNFRAGFSYRENESLINLNCGQKKTWTHEFQSFRLPNTKVDFVLRASNLPKVRIET